MNVRQYTTSMTKRLHFTLEEVLEDVLSDDEDLDDPDEPMMEGSDDEFSDLEVDDEDEDDIDSAMDTNRTQGLTAQKYRYSLVMHISSCKNRPQIYQPHTLFFLSTPEGRPSHISRALESRPSHLCGALSLSAFESRPSKFSQALSLRTRVQTLSLLPRTLSLSALECRPSHFSLLSNCAQLSPW